MKKFGKVKANRIMSADNYFYFMIFSEKALPRMPKQIEKYSVHFSHLELMRWQALMANPKAQTESNWEKKG